MGEYNQEDEVSRYNMLQIGHIKSFSAQLGISESPGVFFWYVSHVNKLAILLCPSA